MKARALRPFIMGSSKYEEGQIIDLPDDRVARLGGEGLVVAVEEAQAKAPEAKEPEAKQPEPAAKAPEPIKSKSKKNRRKK